MDEREKFIIFDGNSYLFRARYAVTVRRGRKARRVSVPGTFLHSLLAVIRDEKPTHAAVCFDAPTPAVRHRGEIVFRATRPMMPPELKLELPRVKELVSALGIPVFELEGYGADDCIGTITEKVRQERPVSILIVTGDRLIYQLVDERVQVMNPHQDNLIYDAPAVARRFGVEPRDLPLLLALTGDNTENLRGLPGMGEKRGAELISRYKTLPEMISRAEEIGGKLGAAIRSESARLRTDIKIATIDRALPLVFDLESCRLQKPDGKKVAEVAERLGIKEAVAGMLSHEEPRDVRYRTVLDENSLDELIKELEEAEEFSVDTETTGLDPLSCKLVGMSFSTHPFSASYIPLGHSYIGAPRQLERETVFERLRPLLEANDGKKIGQNSKFDMQVLATNGIEVRGVFFDTMVASYLLRPGEGSNSLGAMAMERLGYKMTPTESILGLSGTMAEAQVETVAEYACEDADITLRLKTILQTRLKEDSLEQLFRDVEMPLVGVLARMERTGVLVGREQLKQLAGGLSKRAAGVAEKIYELAGQRFNIDSPKQLGAVLFDKMGLRSSAVTRKGARSTSQEVLAALAGQHEIVRQVLEFRELSKLVSGYVEPLVESVNPQTGRIHTSYHQAATATGRLSSSNPNLQNVPVRTGTGREVRRAFIAPEGRLLLSSDYNQVELRILAHFSEDEALVASFREGRDIHADTAHRVFSIPLEKIGSEERRRAKTINFGIIYGMGPRGLARQLGVTVEEAEKFIRSYFQAYPGIRAWIDRSLAEVRRTQVTRTLLGRPRRFPDIESRNPNLRQATEREAINAPIQGSAADIIKLAMIRIDRKLTEKNLAARMTMQVHDELVFEVPREELPAVKDIARTEMEGAYPLAVPLTVDITTGPNWLEMG